MDIRIAVIDDDETDREDLTERIQSYFSRISQHDLAIYSFSSCEEFMAHHIYGSVHAVFLDIFMEGITGLELGKRLRDENPILAIVFVTSSPDLYAEAAPLGMFDYLQKPFDAARLHAMLDRMLAYLPMVNARAEKTVNIKVPHNVIQLRLSDIICALSNNHITEVYAKGHDRIESNMKYSQIAALLKDDDRFLECNRGVIANMEHIVSMTDKVYMSNGLELPIKIRERTQLLGIFSEYSIHRMTEL